MSSAVPQQQPAGLTTGRHPNANGSGHRPSAVTDPNGPAPPRRSTSVRRTPSAGPGDAVAGNRSDLSTNSNLAASSSNNPSQRRVPTPITTSFGNPTGGGRGSSASPQHQHFSSTSRSPRNANFPATSPTSPNAQGQWNPSQSQSDNPGYYSQQQQYASSNRHPPTANIPRAPTSPISPTSPAFYSGNRPTPAVSYGRAQVGSSGYGPQVGHAGNDWQHPGPRVNAGMHHGMSMPPQQPPSAFAEDIVEDPYDILSDYAHDTGSSNGDSDHFAQNQSHMAQSSTDSDPSARGQQPAPWAFKPRATNKPPKSAVEAANSAQAPNALGLKHEETTSPNAFVVDEDFERIVQEIVPNFDHPETPSLTFRVFFLGMLFNVILAFANTIFSFRTNYFMLNSYVGILLAYPMGKFLENYVPDYTWYTRWFKLSLNPGPFTVKEHVLIGIWATTGASGAYGTSNIVVQELFYNLKLTHLTSIAFLVCLNLIGFGFSGLFRRWVIRPIEMIWPTVLPFVSLYSAFHGGLKRDAHSDSDSVIDPSHKSKLRYFFIAIVACFAYHMVGPQYMSAGVASIPLLCFFFPSSNFFWRWVVGSQKTGVGAFSITFDWSLVGSIYQTVPFWTTLSQTIGTVALQWIAVPLAVHQNWFNAPDMPRYTINRPDIFDNSNDKQQDVLKALVLPPGVDGIKLDPVAYEQRKPYHMTPFFAMAYFSSMAQFSSAFFHCIVWYGSSIWRRFRGVNKHKEGLDIHCLLIDQYDEVPLSLYLLLLALITAATVVVCQLSDMAMPWYMTLLAIGFSAIACFPIAIILATTGVQLYLNVVSQFLLGLLMPGFPIVQMAFKSVALSVGQQCMFLLTDLKLGHYMKIPPRHIFITQVTASIVSALVSYAATVYWLDNPDHQRWIRDHHDIGDSDPGKSWGSNGNRVFYNASVIWGLIGPRRFFFETAYGAVILWGLVIGAMTPILIKMLDLVSGKRIPWKYVQGPLIFNGVMPGMDQSYVFTGFLLSLFFQFFMYRYRTNWWKRYNYILACALDVGVAIAAFVTTFALNGWGVEFPEWFLNPGNPDFCFVPKELIPAALRTQE